MNWEEILNFWFEEIEPAQHWKKDLEFDQLIRDRFGVVHAAAVSGELWEWRDEPLGRLAEIIVIDQFSRNMFRGRPESFAYDRLALTLAQEAVRSGADQALEKTQLPFLYMPYMHSESKKIHEVAMILFKDLPNLDYEIKHKEIVDRFGRYPHRNEILGRGSTPEEIEFLKQPGSSF
ncbi:MAG: DUF924 family protein [Chloroflexota bacterium]